MNQFWVADIGAHLYIRDETDIFGLIQTGHYEPEETAIIKKFVEKSSVCIDIGANIGYFTVLMAKLGKYVYSFEPEISNYKMLIDNITLNKIDNAYPVMFAVGDESRLGDLYLCDSNHGMHRMYRSKWCNTEPKLVSMISLDEEFARLEPNFVKIDVEGWEMDVLQGMRGILAKSKPTMLIEFHPPTLLEAGTEPRALYNFIVKAGYDVYFATDMKRIGYDELYTKTNDSMGGQNIVCIPSTS